MELISRRTPSPEQANRGKTNCEGSRWVSRTRRRIGSETRRRRFRWMGKGTLSYYTNPPQCGGWPKGTEALSGKVLRPKSIIPMVIVLIYLLISIGILQK